MDRPTATIIAAYAQGNRVIGVDNKLPWKIPSDLKHFKKVTKKGVMIMGANTWRSFKNKALPGRTHIIVTRDPEALIISDKDRPIVHPVMTLDVALMLGGDLASKLGRKEYFVIGGAQIYATMVPWAQKMILTEVENPVAEDGEYTYTGDTFFPEFSLLNWNSITTSKTSELPGEPVYRIVTYARNYTSATEEVVED